MRKRNIQIIIRLDKDEHEHFKKRVKKSGLSQEAYMRHLIGGIIPTDAPPPDYHAMMRELRAIGNNLNQIAQKARALNAIDVKRYDENAAALNKAVLVIANAVMLPRKIERSSEREETEPPRSPQTSRGEEQPRSGEPFAARGKRDKRRAL
jgi:hypothetical protein